MPVFLAAQISTPDIDPSVMVWVLTGIIIGIWFGRRMR